MKMKRIPSYLADSIYEIPVSFFLEHNIKNVLSDLDNTLDSVKTKSPGEKAFELKKRLEEAGITIYIASNNTSKRVKRYSEELGVKALSGLRKPFASKLKKILVREGFKKEETCLIGDQIMTDCIAANKAGIMSILTDPLVKIDPIWTKLNRLLEKRLRKKINEQKLVERIKNV